MTNTEEDVRPNQPVEPAKPPWINFLHNKRDWIFIIGGFLGFYILNGIYWLLFRTFSSDEHFFILLLLCSFPINILVAFILGVIRRTRKIALGILIAWAVNFVISILLGLDVNAGCLIPFYFPPN